MDAVTRNQINELLLQALKRPAEDRAAFLAVACPEEAPRREIQSLLDSDPEILFEIDQPAVDLLGPMPEDYSARDRIGPYEILHELGRGGTGAVYLARRTDGGKPRRVAIKVLKRGMDTDEIVRRFRNERDILSGLQHPNIAELLEGGTTDNQRLYFVMEYIDGEPIDSYCDRRQLSLRRRLELFLKVCSAIQFAHQNLVVHRDLKPSNILVDAEGEPKLLDFGIAKFLQAEDRSSATLTREGLRPMTPEYASPEQVRGEPITTASDVYSLGVLLFELLTDLRPYRLKSRSDTEMRRVICEEPAPKASAAVLEGADPRPGSDGAAGEVDPRKLSRRLTGDLDTILGTALRKEAGRRYPSVELLAQDLRRYLDGLPIRARKETVVYRLGKFIRRHPRLIVAVALGVLLLFAFVVDRELMRRETARERDRVVQIASLLVGIYDRFDFVVREGDHHEVRGLLNPVAEMLPRIREEQPELQAMLLQILGRGYRHLGDVQLAVGLQEEALRAWRKFDPVPRIKVAESLNDLAAVEVDLGRYARAEAHHRDALEIYGQLLEPDDPKIAKTRAYVAAALMDQGEYDASEVMFRDHLEHERKRLGDHHPSIAAIESDLGLIHYYRGDYGAAEELLQGALKKSGRHLDREHPQVQSHIANLGTVLRAQGRHEEALEHYREFLNVALQNLGGEHPVVIKAQSNLGALMIDLDEVKSAENLLRGALETGRKVYQGDHPDLATATERLARALTLKGDLDGALHFARRGLEETRRTRREGHPALARAMCTLAEVLEARGDRKAAETLARQALVGFQRILTEGNRQTAETACVLGACLLGLGRYQEAEKLLRDGLAILEAHDGVERRTVETVEDLIELYEAWGKPEKAEEYRELLAELSAAAS